MADDKIEIDLEINEKQATDALNNVDNKSKALQDSLKKIGAVAGVAFAATSAAIGLSVAKYAENERATTKLNQALQTQGIYSARLSTLYQSYAEQLSKVTLYQDDELTSAQGTIQAYTGKLVVSKELLKATADLAQGLGVDLAQAAQIVGKNIEGSTQSLGRSGIETEKASSSSERMANIVKTVAERFNNQSTAAATGVGWFTQFHKAVEKLTEHLGQKFAPVLILAAEYGTKFFYAIADNAPLIKFIAISLGIVAAISGVVAGFAGLGLAFTAIAAVMPAIIAGLTTIGGFLVSTALPIIGIIAAVTALGVGIAVFAANWEQNWSNIADIAIAAGKVIGGAFTFDSKKMSEGFAELKNAVIKAGDELINNETMDAVKKKIQDTFAGGSEDERAEQDQYILDTITIQNGKVLENNTLFQEQNGKMLLYYGDKNKQISKANFDAQLDNQKTFLSTVATLQTAKNKELAAIGKAAAILDIALRAPDIWVKSYEYGMGIGGPVLGAVFGAIAETAVAVQAAKIAGIKVAKGGFAQGGSITSGLSSVDNVPAILQRGEFVAPKESAQDIIDARARELAGQSNNNQVEVQLSFKDNIGDFIDATILRRRSVGVGAL